MSKSLKYRADKRSLSVFEHNIADYTEREQVWATVLAKQWEATVIDTGVDSTGSLIKDKLPHYNQDKIFKIGDLEIPVDIKCIPLHITKFHTFKAFDLENCLKKNARIMVPLLDRYFIYKLDAIKRIIDEKIGYGVYHSFAANKPSYRVMQKERNQMIDSGSVFEDFWKEEAKEIIQKNINILDRKKAS